MVPTLTEWRDNWRHLRIAFQLTLAPIFLWGWCLAAGHFTGRILQPFVALHLLLYTGITAFNSYFDRDEGPIGGLEFPPPVSPTLLALALALKLAGFVIALWVGAAFAAIYAVFIALSFLYSHPSTRWKANPWLSAAVVCLGQGGLGFLAGWAAARGEIASAWNTRGMLGCAVAALTTLGMYPITQVYQVEEDSRRGDRTLCVALGQRGGLTVSQVAFVAAGVAAAALMARFYTVADAAILAMAYIFLVVIVAELQDRIAGLRQTSAFRAVMFLNFGAAAAFAAFIALRLARW